MMFYTRLGASRTRDWSAPLSSRGCTASLLSRMHRLLRAIASPSLGHHQRRRLLSAYAADQPICHHPPIDSAVLWNKLLRDHLSRSRPDLALALYRLMRALSPGLPNSYTLPLALRAAPFMRIASTVHAHALHLGLHAHPDVASQILAAYARLGRASEARHVFDALPVRRTTLSWNTLITAYSIGCDPDAARAAFARMVARMDHAALGAREVWEAPGGS